MPSKLPERKKTVLCSDVDNALALVRQIRVKHSFTSETSVLAAGVLDLLHGIKQKAKAMETRLYLYKETIEGLGFKRVRKRYARPT